MTPVGGDDEIVGGVQNVGGYQLVDWEFSL